MSQKRKDTRAVAVGRQGGKGPAEFPRPNETDGVRALRGLADLLMGGLSHVGKAKMESIQLRTQLDAAMVVVEAAREVLLHRETLYPKLKTALNSFDSLGKKATP